MEPLLLFTFSLALGGALLFVLARSHGPRFDPVRTGELGVFVLVGGLSVVPGFFLYALADAVFPPASHRAGQVLFIWTVNAPGEELAKYLCFALTATLLRTIREPHDGSLQGAATGLGFGLVENFLYGLSGGWQLLLLRSLVSLPGHIIYGAVWGGYHGFEVYQGRGRLSRAWVPLLALVPAIFAHAVFNTLALVGAPLAFAVAGDALILGFGAFLFLRLRALSPSRVRRPLREWHLAIPELEHALDLNPRSTSLRCRLAAYHLVADQPERALAVLASLPNLPWVAFYRAAALFRKNSASSPVPPEASLDPKLFRRLSGG